MDDHCIDSQGFCVGGWGFPPFSLRRGECITLNLPQEARTDHESIVATLTGSKPVAGLNLCASVVYVESAISSSGWRRWFRDPTPWDWLKENTTLSEDVIQSILIEHEMDRRIPLSSYAGTPRLILGLHAAYARNPAVIVFSTAGLDPRGVQAAHRIVSRHLTECAAIYLAWPFSCQGQEQRTRLPGSLSLSVTDNSGAPGVRPNAAASK